LVSPKDKREVEKTVEIKLNELQEIGEGNYRINPTKEDTPFNAYVQFAPYASKSVAKWGGRKNWEEYMSILDRLSEIVADMAKKNLFDSAKRCEVLHLFCNMLQMHETGAVRIFAGYQDFLNRNEVYYYE